MTKRGISANGYYNKSGKFGNNSLKLRINSTEMTKETGWLLAIFANISDLAKIANLARIDERLVKNLGRIHERFVQNSNEMKKKRLFWQMAIFQNWPVLPKNGELDKSLSNVWQKLLNESTQRKLVKIWVPVEIEPRVVKDLMVLKLQRNIWQSTWHCCKEQTKHFYCRWRSYIRWLKYFHRGI